MTVTHKVTVDLHRPEWIQLIHAVQCDANTRALELTLEEGGKAWTVPSGSAVSVAFRKADGKAGWYDTLPDGTKACGFSGNVVTAVLAPQVLTAWGKAEVVVIVQDPDTLDQIGAFPVTVEVARNPAAGKGISNDYYAYGTMAEVNEALGVSLMYRGLVTDHGTFAGCTEMGYYRYAFSDITNIDDAPEGLASGGVLEVRPNAARDTTFQTIHCANGERWFRFGKHDFEKIGSKWSEVDDLYKLMGIVKLGTLVQGAPSNFGKILDSSKSICAEGPVYLGAGVEYNVLLAEGWNYSVTEFDDEACTSLGQRDAYMTDAPVFVPQKDWGWIRFNKRDDSGTVVEIKPTDFSYSAVFRKADKVDTGVRSDVPESIGVLNAILNAKQCQQIVYTPLADMPPQLTEVQETLISGLSGSDKKKYNRYYPGGEELQGLPYSSTRVDQLYVPTNVSFYTFMSALKNPNADLYTERLFYNNGSTCYGIVCSMLAGYALGIKPGYTTELWSQIPGMEEVERSAYGLKLCDILWRSGHVLLVTDIRRDSRGRIYDLEITEATATGNSVVRAIRYTLEAFNEEFVNGSTEYKFYRYAHIAKVTHTPTGIVPVEGERVKAPSYNTVLMGRLGDQFNVLKGDTVTLDVLDRGSYTRYAVGAATDDQMGTKFYDAPIPSSGVMDIPATASGTVAVCLTNDDGSVTSDCIQFCVVDPGVALSNDSSGNCSVRFNGTDANATPLYLMWVEEGVDSVTGVEMVTVRQIDELTAQEAAAGAKELVGEPVAQRVKVAFQTEFGIIMSRSVEVTA